MEAINSAICSALSNALTPGRNNNVFPPRLQAPYNQLNLLSEYTQDLQIKARYSNWISWAGTTLYVNCKIRRTTRKVCPIPGQKTPPEITSWRHNVILPRFRHEKRKSLSVSGFGFQHFMILVSTGQGSPRTSNASQQNVSVCPEGCVHQSVFKPISFAVGDSASPATVTMSNVFWPFDAGKVGVFLPVWWRNQDTPVRDKICRKLQGVPGICSSLRGTTLCVDSRSSVWSFASGILPASEGFRIALPPDQFHQQSLQGQWDLKGGAGGQSSVVFSDQLHLCCARQNHNQWKR